MKKRIHTIFVLAIMAATVISANAQTRPSDLLEQKTLKKIAQFDAEWDGVLGVAALDLGTGHLFAYNGEVVFPQASSIKIPIMIELFRQDRANKINLQASFEITDRYLVGGSGKFQETLKAGQSIKKPIIEIIQAMIEWSDNVATNVCIDLVGMDNVNSTLNELGFGATRLQRKMMDGEAVARNDENISTPIEMARMAQMLYEGAVVDAQACEQMVAILASVDAAMRKAVPAQYKVAAKPGWVTDARCETGIVFLDDRPFVLSVMSTYNGPGNGNPVGPITEIVFDHFERLAHSNLYGHRTGERPK